MRRSDRLSCKVTANTKWFSLNGLHVSSLLIHKHTYNSYPSFIHHVTTLKSVFLCVFKKSFAVAASARQYRLLHCSTNTQTQTNKNTLFFCPHQHFHDFAHFHRLTHRFMKQSSLLFFSFSLSLSFFLVHTSFSSLSPSLKHINSLSLFFLFLSLLFNTVLYDYFYVLLHCTQYSKHKHTQIHISFLGTIFSTNTTNSTTRNSTADQNAAQNAS